MKILTIDKKAREVLIDGKLAGVGWTAKMEKDIELFGNKIILAVTKCMFIKVCEKHSLNIFEKSRLKSTLSLIF